jgi:hypothetical protein
MSKTVIVVILMYYCQKPDCLCGLVARVLATDPKVRVRFPALPDFLSSSGSGTGSYWKEKVAAPV